MADSNKPDAQATAATAPNTTTVKGDASAAPISPAPTAAAGTSNPQPPGAPPPATPGNTTATLDSGKDSGSTDPKLNRQPSAGAEEMAAANRTPTEAQIADANAPISLKARAGYPFNLEGRGFGNEKGVLTVNGRTLETSRWNDRSVKGQLPHDIESGEVTLRTASGHERKGTFTRLRDPR
jgi:hypothetical protein